MKTVLVLLYFLLYVCFMATCFMFAIGPPSDKIDEIVTSDDIINGTVFGNTSLSMRNWTTITRNRSTTTLNNATLKDHAILYKIKEK